MGISTLQSYCGGQIFEAVGLDSELVSKYFTGTPTRIEGMSLEMLEMEAVKKHKNAFSPTYYPGALEPGGLHYYRKHSDPHIYNSNTILKLQESTKNNDYKMFREFSDIIDKQHEGLITLRSLFQIDESKCKPIPIEEVEPASEIVTRFQTGAMSFGSISAEAHTSMAIAMNRIGAKSNTGEGGRCRTL